MSGKTVLDSGSRNINFCFISLLASLSNAQDYLFDQLDFYFFSYFLKTIRRSYACLSLAGYFYLSNKAFYFYRKLSWRSRA